MVVKLVERSFQRHRVCSIPSSYERGSFYPILKERKLGFLRVKKRERREEEEEIKEIRQDHRGFSSGVIPIKVCEFLVLGDPFLPHTKLIFL
ncbi:hypothetical protein MTR67_038137 [Solanum verrucosum]|uniref:Uncharacterized protein n=1 Tax=Solanum verrucosum TaxID=315347 RepID=A0AAF0UEX3_SOLVR|nr:hypothetical protein MTR67_038137 [Solanum verrucosum]